MTTLTFGHETGLTILIPIHIDFVFDQLLIMLVVLCMRHMS
jgi:hypothetical protein